MFISHRGEETKINQCCQLECIESEKRWKKIKEITIHLQEKKINITNVNRKCGKIWANGIDRFGVTGDTNLHTNTLTQRDKRKDAQGERARV